MHHVIEPAHHGTVASLFAMLLRYSHGADLHLIDGSGDTALHVAVKRGLSGAVQAILNCRPELLGRENAAGRTPLELAEDLALSYTFAPEHQNRVPQHFRPAEWADLGYGHGYRLAQGIIGRTPKELRELRESQDEWRASQHKVLDICREFAAARMDQVKDQGSVGAVEDKVVVDRRTLVTLNEANEVAKRISAISDEGAAITECGGCE